MELDFCEEIGNRRFFSKRLGNQLVQPLLSLVDSMHGLTELTIVEKHESCNSHYRIKSDILRRLDLRNAGYDFWISCDCQQLEWL